MYICTCGRVCVNNICDTHTDTQAIYINASQGPSRKCLVDGRNLYVYYSTGALMMALGHYHTFYSVKPFLFTERTSLKP